MVAQRGSRDHVIDLSLVAKDRGTPHSMAANRDPRIEKHSSDRHGLGVSFPHVVIMHTERTAAQAKLHCVLGIVMSPDPVKGMTGMERI